MLAELAGDEARVARELAVDCRRACRERWSSAASDGPRTGRRDRAHRRELRELLGDYAHLLHIETLLEMREQGNAFRFPLTDEIVPADELAGRTTIFDAITAGSSDAPGRACAGNGDPWWDGRRDPVSGRARAIVRRGDRRPRTLRPDRHRHDRGVTRPAGPGLHGSSAGAARGRRRDRDAGGARGGQRPAAGDRMGGGHCAAVMLAWVPGTRAPRRSPRHSSAT